MQRHYQTDTDLEHKREIRTLELGSLAVIRTPELGSLGVWLNYDDINAIKKIVRRFEMRK